MATDPLFDLLVKQSVTRLREMQAAIREQRRNLDFEDAVVTRALVAKGAEPDNKADESETPAVMPTPAHVVRRGVARNESRDAIKRTMRTDASRVWLPSDVEKALADSGVTLARAAIRNAMRRMVETGELRRPPGPNPQGFLLVQDENGAVSPPGQDELSASMNGSAATEADQAEDTAGFQNQ